MFGRIYFWSHLLGIFKITHSISLLVLGLFTFSVSSKFSLGIVYISRNLFISSQLSILFIVVSYDLLYFCGVCRNFFFISDLIDLDFLNFFSWWVWLKVYQFCLPFQRPSSKFHRSFFKVSIFYLFCSDLYDFFPSTNFGMFCPFSSSFGYKVRLLESCLSSWGKLVSVHLRTAFAASHRFWII